jgi:hypothetical protein
MNLTRTRAWWLALSAAVVVASGGTAIALSAGDSHGAKPASPARSAHASAGPHSPGTGPALSPSASAGTPTPVPTAAVPAPAATPAPVQSLPGATAAPTPTPTPRPGAVPVGRHGRADADADARRHAGPRAVPDTNEVAG